MPHPEGSTSALTIIRSICTPSCRSASRRDFKAAVLSSIVRREVDIPIMCFELLANRLGPSEKLRNSLGLLYPRYELLLQLPVPHGASCKGPPLWLWFGLWQVPFEDSRAQIFVGELPALVDAL